MEKTNGGAKLNTVTDILVDWYSYSYSVPKDIAEDIINEFEYVVTAYFLGERDDYNDYSEIIYDYLGIESSEYNEITEGRGTVF